MLLQPIECEKCETRFCRDCFSEYDTQRRNICPNLCKIQYNFVQMRDLSDVHLDELKNIIFKC